MKCLIKKMSHTVCVTLVALGLGACGGSNSNSPTSTPTPTPTATPDPQEPDFSASLFSDDSYSISNVYYPLLPGQRWVYEGENDDGELERVEVSVSHLTRTVNGVGTAIVVAREYVVDEDGEAELTEETFDWYAQDSSGNVWYMGEDVSNFEDGEFVDSAGSWESGLDVASVGSTAIAGIIMKSELVVGDTYIQENYPGEAEDSAEIFSLSVSTTLDTMDTYDALQIREWNPLEPEEQDEYKFYASGVGLIVEENADGTERIELVSQSNQMAPNISADDFSNPRVINNIWHPLTIGDIREYEVYEEDELVETISIEILSLSDEGGNKTVNGVPVIVQRDRVRDADGLIIEDTFDWFAQDDAGNVWYMGEEVTNYNYDDEGNLIDTDNGGSFEWGVDGAQPGVQMLVDPRVGDSYRQEYYQDEAEDVAAVIGIDEPLTIDGEMLETLVTEDWNPLEPEDAREHKYYAMGIGVVREEKTDDSEYVEIVDRGIIEPTIAPSDFTNPRVIDNTYFPMPIGEVREYEVYEDGELSETITIEILATSDENGDKTVNGVPVVVQRDRVRNTDAQVIEDTYDWFAQDDAGNVWYLGEYVVNYRYDDEGNLLSTDNAGSFEWGIDGALPGIQMQASPAVGDYYRQEWYQGEAEDVAMVKAAGVPITIGEITYTTLHTLDWNPLDEDMTIEAKYYAPGIGTVREEKLDGSEYVILVDRTSP